MILFTKHHSHAFLWLFLFGFYSMTLFAQDGSSKLQMKELGTEYYFEGETMLPDTSLNWFGIEITTSGTKCYSVKTKIEIIDNPHFDKEEMENNGHTDYEVSEKQYVFSVEGRTPSYVISGIDNMHEGEIKTISLPTTNFFPGDRLDFVMDEKYTLMAFGDGPRKYSQGEPNKINNYRLYLKGTNAPQLLLKADFFDDNFFEILWVGDIDYDNKPDLLLQTSHKYTSYSVALLLSSKAKENEYVASYKSAGDIIVHYND